jgi:peptidoglycan/LPS O-acetylase OafA/YrhL
MVFLPVTLWALGGDGMLARLLSIPELRWLGNISYSYYLVHTLAINFIRVGVIRSGIAGRHPLMSWILLFPVTLGLSVIIAVILFVLVERRFSIRPSASPDKVKAGRIRPDDRQEFVMAIQQTGDAVGR